MIIAVVDAVAKESLKRSKKLPCLSNDRSTTPASQRSRVQIPYKPEFFTGSPFATTKLRLQDLQLLDTTTVLIYDFHIFIIYFPSIVLQAIKGNSTAITGKIIQEASQWNFSQKVDDTQTSIKWTLSGPRQVSPEGGLGWGLLRTSFFYSASESAAVNKDI